MLLFWPMCNCTSLFICFAACVPSDHRPIFCTHTHTFLLAQQLQPQCLCCFCSVSAFEAESKVAFAKLEDFLTEASILQVCTSLLCASLSLQEQHSQLMLVFIIITPLQDITINWQYCTCTTRLMHRAGDVSLSCSQLAI
jgi:hypothetical protein